MHVVRWEESDAPAGHHCAHPLDGAPDEGIGAEWSVTGWRNWSWMIRGVNWSLGLHLLICLCSFFWTNFCPYNLSFVSKVIDRFQSHWPLLLFVIYAQEWVGMVSPVWCCVPPLASKKQFFQVIEVIFWNSPLKTCKKNGSNKTEKGKRLHRRTLESINMKFQLTTRLHGAGATGKTSGALGSVKSDLLSFFFFSTRSPLCILPISPLTSIFWGNLLDISDATSRLILIIDCSGTISLTRHK